MPTYEVCGKVDRSTERKAFIARMVAKGCTVWKAEKLWYRRRRK